MSYYICEKYAQCIDCPNNCQEEKCGHWVEVEEVKHSYWIDAREQCGSFVCSNCEYQSKAQYNFCPNCGAKMDGGANSETNRR